jgi:hypothetical protein
MNIKIGVQKEILHRTNDEITKFKIKVIGAYKEHMAAVEKVPRDCQNEFIKKTLKEGKPKIEIEDDDLPEPAQQPRQPRQPNQSGQPGQSHQKPANKGNLGGSREFQKNEKNSIKFEIDVNDSGMNPVSSSQYDTTEGPEGGFAGDTEEVPLFKSKNQESKPDLKKGGDIFFKKNQDLKSGRSKQLRFGGNNQDNDE